MTIKSDDELEYTIVMTQSFAHLPSNHKPNSAIRSGPNIDFCIDIFYTAMKKIEGILPLD